MSQTKAKKLLFISGIIILSSLIRAVSIHVFILGNNFAPGGVTGIATMLEYGTKGISSGYFIILFNAPLLLLALKYINKSFVIKTASTIVLSSVFLIILQILETYLQGLEVPKSMMFIPEEKIFAAAAGGCLMGLSLFLMLKIGGSTGGTDIVAYIIQKRNEATNVAWFIFILDSIVIAASFFVYDFKLEPVILAIAELFVSSKITEALTQGTKSAIKFEVITDTPDELIAEILKNVRCGVTRLDAVGAYSNSKKGLLFCIVHKRHVSAFKQVLKQFSGTTFSYVSSTSEVLGKGFS